MSGEDVYDLAVWCRWCDAPHADCEPVAEDNECLVCCLPIPEGDYCPTHDPERRLDFWVPGTYNEGMTDITGGPKRVGRPPRHPSGSGRKTNIYLSPYHLELLDSLISDEHTSRSAVIVALLDIQAMLQGGQA